MRILRLFPYDVPSQVRSRPFGKLCALSLSKQIRRQCSCTHGLPAHEMPVRLGHLRFAPKSENISGGF